jgi:hypothetical protein
MRTHGAIRQQKHPFMRINARQHTCVLNNPSQPAVAADLVQAFHGIQPPVIPWIHALSGSAHHPPVLYRLEPSGDQEPRSLIRELFKA